MMKVPRNEVQIIEGDAYISLTNGYVTVVNQDDLPILDGMRFHAEDGKFPLVYAVSRSKGKDLLRMHRILIGAKKGQKVDHIDGNGLNNRRSNLRFATSQQNGRNCRKPINNTSGYKGVTWNKRGRKWVAQIMFCKKKIGLGRYKTATSAYAAYCIASALLHGEFGRTN